MFRFYRVLSSAFLLYVLGCFAFAPSAFAGFQWVAPSNDVPAPAAVPSAVVVTGPATVAPVVSAPPSSSIIAAPNNSTTNYPVSNISNSNDVSSSIVTPITVDGDAAAVRESQTPIAPEALVQPLGDIASPVVISGSMSNATVTASPGDVVHGFASDVPVVVALRQILPPGYAFSIAPHADTKIKVSFQGGRPWRDTLRDTLAPAGLSFHENGQMVTVGYAADTGAAVGSSVVYQPGLEPHVLPLHAGSSSAVLAPYSPPAPMVIQSARGRLSDVHLDNMNDNWDAERGGSLHKTLEEWCHRAHVELNWLAEYDYPLDATVGFTGTFQDAVRNLLAGFETAHPQPVAELHSNPAIGQMVLVVQVRGNTGTD